MPLASARRLVLDSPLAIPLLIVATLLALALLPLHAPAAQDRAAIAAQRDAALQDLAALSQEIELTDARQAELRAEIAAINRDQAALNSDLIATNARIQEIETDLAATEDHIAEIIGEEAELRTSLAERRGVLALVLAALQRMGRDPAPAIIVQPEDALASVRSAILLGAVLPEIQGEVDQVLTDLQTLADLRSEGEQERERLRVSNNLLAEEVLRLEVLIEEKQAASAASNDQLGAEMAHAQELAANAADLEALVADLEATISRPVIGPIEPGRPVLLGAPDRITPAIPFPSARGLLPRPAAGTLVTDFGDTDEFGDRAQGITIATRSGARVASPADGWVEFAGPYASYRNLLIINPGDGYLIVISGMDRLNVQVGQFVLAGEPIGTMEAARVAGPASAAAVTIEPQLYLELRRNRVPIDPGPWWADPY